MENLNGHGGVPILGMKEGRAGGQIAGLARRLDENGTFPAMAVRGPQGQMVLSPDRECYLDAEELLVLIREAVREEVRAVLREETDAD